jgi:hypothetical protein
MHASISADLYRLLAGIAELPNYAALDRNVNRKSPKFALPQSYAVIEARKLPDFDWFVVVPGGGVEPPRPEGRRILSPLRLPVPPSRLFEESNRYDDYATDFWQFVHDSFVSAQPR